MSYEQSYPLALEQAGATVHAYEEFGSYQGDWYALVTFRGRTGWAHGSFGSCSGCDAFQNEFNYASHAVADKWHDPVTDDPVSGCSACDAFLVDLAAFGLRYLETMLTQEEAVAAASEYESLDMEAGPMLTFILSHSIKEPMNEPSHTDKMKNFIAAWQASSSVTEVAERTGLSRQTVYSYLNQCKEHGITLKEMPRVSRHFRWDEIKEFAATVEAK